MRNTWRGSQNYMEKTRWRREIELTRSQRGEIERGESKLASNQFPMCSPQSGPLGEVHGITKKEKRDEGDRSDQEDKRMNENETDRSRH